MKVFLALAVILHVSLGSHVSVRLPYQNPAGVTYLNGYYQGHEFPAASSSSSLSSSSSSSSPIAYSAPGHLQYQQGYQQGYQYQQGFQYQQPLQYQQASQYQPAYRYAAAPIYQSAKIEAHHVGYAAAQVPAVAAVPFVKHVPTVSHIPVTRYEAQPAVIEKQLDVAKPAISTRKFEVRRPAIQKQFYDIEERVIIRPAGSAVVELEEPTSKLQRGPEVVQSLEANAYAAQSQSPHKIVAQAFSFGQGPSSQSAVPVIAHAPVHVTIAPVISHAPVSHIQSSPSTPAPVAAADSSESQQSESQSSDEEVVVDNADFRSAQFSGSSSAGRSFGQGENSAGNNQQQQQQQQQQLQQQQQQQFFQRSSQEANSRQASPAPSTPNVEARSNGVAVNSPSQKFLAHDYNPSNSQVIPSVRNSPEESQSNQQRLIDLLTARGGVTEVGFGRDGETSGSVSEAGHVRGRVISATPAPEYAEATGERVSTRRVVVSRPIETLQEVDVVEPATKYERVSVQQPTYIKTAHLDHVQVHGSIPVVGKAFAPAIAHAAVPVYQKTISPAYAY